MEKHEFTEVVEWEENGRLPAICTALQGCCVEGETEKEARVSIREAVVAHIESRREHGDPS